MNVLNAIASNPTLLTAVKASSNASRDILQNTRWQGALDSIGWLTNIIDSWFATFISVVALFIISSGLLRNVVAGAYAAYPDFWDKVDNAHKMLKLNTQIIGKFKEVMSGGSVGRIGGEGDDGYDDEGTLATFFYRLLPNFKAISAFKHGIDPKKYFIKAIPQMFGVVFLGIFIWNGYYRDFAAKAGDAGAVFMERILLDVDPVSAVDKLFGLATAPSFENEGANSQASKLTSAIAKGIYTQTIGKYTDIRANQQKQDLASRVEGIAQTFITEISTSDFVLNGFPGGKTTSGNDLLNPELYAATTQILFRATRSTDSDGYSYDETKDSFYTSGDETYTIHYTVTDIRKTFELEYSLIEPTASYTVEAVIKFSRLSQSGTTGSVPSVKDGKLTVPVQTALVLKNKDNTNVGLTNLTSYKNSAGEALSFVSDKITKGNPGDVYTGGNMSVRYNGRQVIVSEIVLASQGTSVTLTSESEGGEIKTREQYLLDEQKAKEQAVNPPTGN